MCIKYSCDDSVDDILSSKNSREINLTEIGSSSDKRIKVEEKDELPKLQKNYIDEVNYN